MNYYNYNNPYQPYQYQYTSTPAPMMLNGKIVDSEEVVKATDVPIGGYGVFPKADLSEIYIKSWNNNGTTIITTFQPVVQSKEKKQEDINHQILQKVEELSEQLKKQEVKNNGF